MAFEAREEARQHPLERPTRELYRLLNGAANPALVGFLLFNLIVLLCRPQNDIAPLAWIAMPMVLSIIALLAVAPKIPTLWHVSPIVKTMFLMLAFGALWVPVARNNRWALNTVQDLTQQYLGYFFPLIIVFRDSRSIKRIVNTLIFTSLYLSLYALTHSGTGPGSYLGDENDMCLMLVLLLGLLMVMWSALPSKVARVFALIAIGLLIVGVVATASRGGFVGLVLMLGILYWKSPHKFATTIAAIVIGIVSLLAAPETYWKDMGTITDTKESTADERLRTWSIAMTQWMTPKNFVFGVGMQNTPYHLGDYEPAFNRTEWGKSLAGRSVHSTYVQLVADLGLAGALLFGWMLWSVWFGNIRAGKQLRMYRKRLPALIASLSTEPAGQASSSGARRDVAPGAEEQTASELLVGLRRLLQRAGADVEYYATLHAATNVSLIGTLGAAAFISTLYYPPIWFLATLSVVIQRYSKQLVGVIEEIAEQMVEQPRLSQIRTE